MKSDGITTQFLTFQYLDMVWFITDNVRVPVEQCLIKFDVVSAIAIVGGITAAQFGCQSRRLSTVLPRDIPSLQHVRRQDFLIAIGTH